MNRRVFLSATAAATAAGSGITAARAADDPLYAAARAEGALTMDIGGPGVFWDAVVAVFQKTYPGIDLHVTNGFSNDFRADLEKQIVSGSIVTDLTCLQTLQDFAHWKKRGALLPYKPDGWEKIPADMKDPEGAFIPILVSMVPYAYNTKSVSPADVPKSALDFLDPKWHGKIVAVYPQDDDVSLFAFYTIVEKYGWTWMDKFMANQPVFIQGFTSSIRSLAVGDALVAPDTVYSMSKANLQAGGAQDVAFSTVDPIPVWFPANGIFKGAPHPNAARLWQRWILGPEFQAMSGYWPARVDQPPPPGARPLSAYSTAGGYLSFVTDDTLTASLRTRFASYVGPVVNHGGVR